MRTKYRVKVRQAVWCWGWRCQGCETISNGVWVNRLAAHAQATQHAAICEALHRANWAAACPSCKLYGVVAKACPVCLGRGHVVEREGLE